MFSAYIDFRQCHPGALSSAQGARMVRDTHPGGSSMFHRLRQSINDRHIGKAMMAAVAASFFMVGLLVASALQLTPASLAQSLSQSTSPPAEAGALPVSFAPLAERLSPTVVNVQVTKAAPVGDFSAMPDLEGPYGELFKRFFRERMPRFEQHRAQGNGSGVIISPDGYILTNNHVVDGAQEVTVTTADKQTYQAKIVGRDAKTDLAVLKIAAKGPLPVAAMGNSADLKVGDWVIAIGNPFGLGHTVTAGIVSAKGRVIGAGPYDDFIQTDAPINPGNSGGPLFDLQGEIVGINTAIVASGQGIGFAIPIDLVKPLIPQLEKTGEVTRGYLGVSIQSITPELAKAMKLENRQGALVADVMPNSSAAKAGIHRGDVIVGFNGAAVQDSHDLPVMVAKTPIGQEATVTLLRNGKAQEVSVTVAKMPSEKRAAAESSPTSASQWGLELQDITPQMARRRGLAEDSGVMVVGVQPGSPADLAGLQRGDIIREVDRQPVHSVQDVREAMAKADNQHSLLLLVQRDQGNIFVAMAK
jgi:serine protease Do